MLAWWSALTSLEQGLACLAIPATLTLIVQTVLVVFSSFDADTDLDGDGILDPAMGSGVQLFTVKGFVSFFCVFGWASILFLKLGLPTVLAILLGVLLGVICMFLMALAFAAFIKLQDSGNIQVSDALGVSATVYIKIPPQRSGLGKISAVVAERYTEFDAMTDDAQPIETGAAVTVIAWSAPNILIVTKK